jgi:hypothetical protein
MRFEGASHNTTQEGLAACKDKGREIHQNKWLKRCVLFRESPDDIAPMIRCRDSENHGVAHAHESEKRKVIPLILTSRSELTENKLRIL